VNVCLKCERDKPIAYRGQCSTCYIYSLRDIKAGLTSWESLIAQGKALPSAWSRDSMRHLFVRKQRRA
jgi:hypothetical protein